MEDYADKFRKQMYGAEASQAAPDAIREAREISHRSAAQLREVGLDFTFLLE